MLGTLDFKGSEHWASNFLTAQPWLSYWILIRQDVHVQYYSFKMASVDRNFFFPDLPTPKRQKMWDSEPTAEKSSEKWVKSREMSKISYKKDFQWGLWGLEVTYHITYHFLWIELAIYGYLTWKQTLHVRLQNYFWSLTFQESVRNQSPTRESMR